MADTCPGKLTGNAMDLKNPCMEVRILPWVFGRQNK